MSKPRRFMAAICVGVLGLIPTLAYWLVLNAFVMSGTLPYALVTYVVGLAIFGITTSALYTWAVDGRRVDSRSAGSRLRSVR